MEKLLVIFFLLTHTLAATAQDLDSNSRPSLQQYVGYYHVGVKPKAPFFYARAFIRNRNLCIIFDGDTGSELIWKEGERFSLKGDTTLRYQVTFTRQAGVITGLKVDRPRAEWPTDLYGYRVEEWNRYAVDTEQDLQLNYASPHFTFYYSTKDSADIPTLAARLEETYHEKLRWFNLAELPNTSIRIYPDKDTYHNAVLTPQAPNWQMGRAWTKDEIRMLSLNEAKKEMGQELTFEQVVQHEWIHCLHWNLISNTRNTPAWLWEGIAMYQGCCRWQNLKDLAYLKTKQYPSLKRIETDRSSELKYQLGYYLIDFIVQTWGREKVLSLINTNGNIKTSLAISRKDFEKKFYVFLEEKHLR
jgi:hypothetical protein